MTYLDKYRSMPTEDLCDWADGLFLKANGPNAKGDPHMTEVRNILPFVVDRLRMVERADMTSEQQSLMNQADRAMRRGQVTESFSLRMQAQTLKPHLDGDRL